LASYTWQENPCSFKAEDKSATPAGGSHGLATGGKIKNMVKHPKTNQRLNFCFYHIYAKSTLAIFSTSGATQFSGSGYGYTFGNYSETLNLGTMTADFTIETIIAVATSFPGYECGARALIGDPGNLNNSPGFTGILQTGGPAPVPEPGTILLFGIGLLGLAGVAQKK
jgi:hypothetical protein